ncbi:hypothetical protein QVD17_17812 [Tagetes erecta]|uniref:SOUL heme-binding protein n=1 Tax=Tagetes erecta TaxID=13708 RepID=A0AAD8P1W3_TARER|nr:hypothetical protein QVD17_17812 [Tagetes erecta]
MSRIEADYEIRKYSPSVVAEVNSEFKDGGFTVLANYIGALGNPRNSKTEKIAMTAPVITKGETMQFILPEKYKKAEEAPEPVDERVVVKEFGERKYGVVGFSGVASEAVVKEKVDKLKKDLERDGFKIAGDFVLARYNPPWTLPPFRTNELMIPVNV